MLSGQDDVATAVTLLKDGALDYVVKDEHTQDRLWKHINHLKDNLTDVEKTNDVSSEQVESGKLITQIQGESLAIKKVFTLLEKAARTDITVSITGETGTGKELAAQTIHNNSTRAKKPFVAVNVSAIPSELIESELFGHVKGAFTGAANNRVGKFEEADKGTIFLDEIGDMDLPMQVKLLRVLQEREVTKIGSNQAISVNARVIVATHKDLAQEVRNGTFREDLYYRLLGLPVIMPPLRDRGSDIILLAQQFISNFAKRNGIAFSQMTPEAKQKLQTYGYPGNVRELKALVELSTVMAENGEITANDLNFHSAQTANGFLLEEKSLKDYTNDIIMHFLDKHDGNVMEVARKLDIGKSTIYRLLQEDTLEQALED